MIPRTLLFASTSFAGMGPYVVSLVNSFDPNDNVRFFLIEGQNGYYTRNIKRELKPLCTIVKAPKPTKLRTLYQLLIDGRNPFAQQIIELYRKEDIKIVHDLTSCSDVSLMKYFSDNGRLVYTVHDMSPHEGKKAFYKQWRQDVLYKRVFKIIGMSDFLYTNSLSQQKQVGLKYPSKVCHYSPFPSLVTEEVATGTMIPPELKDVNRYILFFGRIEAYKGIDILLEAFKKSGIANDVKLVIAGKGELDYDRNDNNIIFINRYIDDREIANLYKNAVCVVYPYISATQSGVLSIGSYFGTPIIASDVEFFKEILGEDYPYLFKAYNSSQLSILLRKMLSDNRKQISNDLMKLYNELYADEISRKTLMQVYGNIDICKTGIYKLGGGKN